MNYPLYNAEFCNTDAGVRRGSEVFFEVRQESAGGEGWELLNRQIRQLLGRECEIDPSFFETLWKSGLQAAIEEWGVRKVGEDRARRGVGREASSEEIFTFAIFRSYWSSFPMQRPARSGGSNGHSIAAASAQGEPCAPEPNEAPADFLKMWLPMTEQRACQVLKVSMASTRSEIKAAYRGMAKEWHPDRLGSLPDDEQRLANQQMAMIHEAYRVLSISRVDAM